MAKVLISADIHFCKRESLVNDRYPFLVSSFEWLEGLKCDYHFDLGDLFNSSSLTAEDVEVLSRVRFGRSWHCITGNHEQDGGNSLLRYFRDIHTVYEHPQLRNFGGDFGWVLLLPFVRNPKPLDFYLSELPAGECVTVFSHCEFSGFFGSDKGFSLDEIQSDPRIKIWFQGHYHSRANPSPKIVVVGNLLGKNFTQNFDNHGVVLYDTVANSYEFLENPYALRFGKMDTSLPECVNIRKMVEADPVKRYVLAIQTDSELRDVLKDWAEQHLVAYRIVEHSVGGRASKSVDLPQLGIDHVQLFYSAVESRFGKDIVDALRGSI